MPISILFNSRKAAKIGELQLDATIQEVHDYKNQVTSFPIEDGSSITDHIKIEPDEFQINGFVTNSPISVFQKNNSEVIRNVDGTVDVQNLQRSSAVNNVELALDKLLKISGRKVEGGNTEPELITIVSGLRVYSNMAILSCTIPRNARTGEALEFSARFKQVKTVATETVVFPSPKANDKDRAQSTVPKGSQNTRAAKTEEREAASVLYNIFF